MNLEFLFKHFWLVMILFSTIRAISMKLNLNKQIIKYPTKKDGYEIYFLFWLIYTIIPILIILLGDLSGSVNNISEFLLVRSKNPFVVALYVYIIICWIFIFWIIYFNNGAKFIENHPGIIRIEKFGKSDNITAKQVKWYFPVISLFGIGFILMLYFNDIPYHELFE